MVLDALKQTDLYRVTGVNPFSSGATGFTGGGQAALGEDFSERLGNGKAAGTNSTGVIGSVSGTGENGVHKLDRYF